MRARAGLSALLLMLVSACTTIPASIEREPAARTPAGQPHWWIVRIGMGYESPAKVRWHLDALLADQVFAPILNHLEPSLVLWRFHRRAAPDATGHQFRFLFYADAAIAARIATALRASSALEALRNAGFVHAVAIPGPGDASGVNVGAQSDPAWPETVKRAWPHFAMGVSRNWLAMVREERRERAAIHGMSIEEQVARYQDINAKVDELWRTNAQHAWLHHLNALFGYQPALIHERRLMRF